MEIRVKDVYNDVNGALEICTVKIHKKITHRPNTINHIATINKYGFHIHRQGLSKDDILNYHVEKIKKDYIGGRKPYIQNINWLDTYSKLQHQFDKRNKLPFDDDLAPLGCYTVLNIWVS